jgi:hypothetical protein
MAYSSFIFLVSFLLYAMHKHLLGFPISCFVGFNDADVIVGDGEVFLEEMDESPSSFRLLEPAGQSPAADALLLVADS